MKTVFYPKLALEGIRKNKKMYIPYLLTCILSVSMYYIMRYICESKFIKSLPKMSTLIQVVALGSGVIAIFSVIFLFYTNSFLIKCRKKEFGLYNILGMDKKGIGKILAFEAFIVSAISIVGGLVIGIGFSKLCEMILVRLVNEKNDYTFTVSFKAVYYTVTLFLCIFFFIFLNSIRQIRFSGALALVKSANSGEKPPKANYVLGIIGFILLGAAYVMAIVIKNPINALTSFFFAVIMVIIGTYLVLISGSVMLCKILQKNKKYYYKKNHFVSVSGMTFRMKRNGAGLASICILLTMVLVMISSTSCLFFGEEDSLRNRYPRDITSYVGLEDIVTTNQAQSFTKIFEDTAKEYGLDIKNAWNYRDSSISGILQDEDYIEIDPKTASYTDYSKLVTVHFVPLEDYNKMYNKNIQLQKGEVIGFATLDLKLPKVLKLADISVNIREQTDKLDIDGSATVEVMPNIFLIIDNIDETLKSVSKLTDAQNDYMLTNRWNYGFDTSAEIDVQEKYITEISDNLLKAVNGKNNAKYSVSCMESERNDFYATFGGFFFIGIMLSVIFLVAAVLIIYYKQISEGFEDAGRFDIMRKLGMTRKDIRKSIDSQMLTVFYLPILFAVLHMSFAFPMIRKLILLFGVTNLKLLIFTTSISIIICGIFYLIIYRLTSNVYFDIVSKKEK